MARKPLSSLDFILRSSIAPRWQEARIGKACDRRERERLSSSGHIPGSRLCLSITRQSRLLKSEFPRIGVLSIDVDGNDYWFLKRLIDAEPEVLCVEYNATLGLAPITVPYDPAFDRMKKHPSGWYHGASLSALCKLAGRYGYGIAAVSEAGANVFFTRDGRLDPSAVWRPNRLRDEWSGQVSLQAVRSHSRSSVRHNLI